MPIAIGQEPDSDFRNPLGLLSDCHRRIELFLRSLIAITDERPGSKLEDESRQQFENALRYFREAAPKHTSDEEDSLFPRMRAYQRPETAQAFALLDKLHTDHQVADSKHQLVDELGRKWLDIGTLSSADFDLLIRSLQELAVIYEKHISLEDNELFPFAERILNRSELEAVATEMAQRRGLGMPAN